MQSQNQRSRKDQLSQSSHYLLIMKSLNWLGYKHEMLKFPPRNCQQLCLRHPNPPFRAEWRALIRTAWADFHDCQLLWYLNSLLLMIKSWSVYFLNFFLPSSLPPFSLPCRFVPTFLHLLTKQLLQSQACHWTSLSLRELICKMGICSPLSQSCGDQLTEWMEVLCILHCAVQM